MAAFLATVLLPVAVGIVMLGLGLSLTVSDFARVLASPGAVVIALACQVLLLPAICFLLVQAFGLAPGLAVGMMLLVASPGGPTANLFSHLFGGDVALNIALNAINSVLAVITLPLVVNFSLDYFVGSGAIGLQLDKVFQVFAIVLIPAAVGVLIRRFAPDSSARMTRPVRTVSMIVLVLTVVAAVLANSDIVLDGLAIVPVALLLGVISLMIGFFVPRLARIERPQAIASAMEIGVHNSVLAITIALSAALLGNREMAVPAAVYAVVIFVLVVVFGHLVGRLSPLRTVAE